MACGRAQQQEVTTTRQNVAFLLGTARSGLIVQPTPQTRGRKHSAHGTFGLLFSFNSVDPPKDLQSLLFKCCLSFYQNDHTIHEHSCTSSTSSGRVQSGTQKVNEEAIFHIVIVLSVIDRNKSMQYSSLAMTFVVSVSDLAPSLRRGSVRVPGGGLFLFIWFLF